MPEANITVGPDWTLLNSSDAVTVIFQNKGLGAIEVARGTATAPVGDVPSYTFAHNLGDRGAIGDVVPGGTGGRLWARSVNGSRVSIGWTV